MPDVIIAIIPAPGHEALVAEGPMGERPALLRGVIGGGWYPPGQLNEHRIPDGRKALALYAPGNPRLGMLRAGAALGDLYQCNEVHGRVVAEVPYMGDSVEVEAPAGFDFADFNAVDALGLAHLLVQRGIAAEVIVLPADKAKETP